MPEPDHVNVPELGNPVAGPDKEIKPGNLLHAFEDEHHESETEALVPEVEQKAKEDDKQRNKDLENRLALIQENCKAMEGEHMMTEQKLMEERGMIESLSQKKEEYNERISKLEAQIVQLTQEVQNLRRDRREQVNEIEKLKQEVQNVRRENKDNSHKIEKLKQELQTLQWENKDQAEKIENLKKEVQNLRSEKRKETAYELETTKERVCTLEGKNENESETTKERVRRLEEKNAYLEKELDTTKERVYTLEEKNDKLARALARLLSSGPGSNDGERNDALTGRVSDVPVAQAEFSKSKHPKSESTVSDSGIDKDMKIDDSYGQEPVEEKASRISGKKGQPELEETSAATAASATHSEMVFGRVSSKQDNKASKEENVGVPVQVTTPDGNTATALVVPTFKSSSSDRSKSHSSLQDIDHSVDYESPAKGESHNGRSAARESEKLITNGVGKRSPPSIPSSETDC